MVVLENALEFDVYPTLEAELVVEREDISFHDSANGTVIVRVKIRNDGGRRSQATVMRLESAPLGAFVRWQPLALLPVPPLEPGESRILTTEALRPRPQTLGDFDNVPPTKLLAALQSSPDEPSRRAESRFRALQGLLRRSTAGATGLLAGLLAPDVSELVGRRNPHWAGNINVFIGNKAVERHVARALRVYAGRPNLAMFVVGDPGTRDAYSFEIDGLAADWKADLFDATRQESLLPARSDESLRQTQWVESSLGHMLVMLMTEPPADCARGRVEVRVTQRSTSKQAVVEFDLDPAAQGPGCYVA